MTKQVLFVSTLLRNLHFRRLDGTAKCKRLFFCSMHKCRRRLHCRVVTAFGSVAKTDHVAIGVSDESDEAVRTDREFLFY